MDTGMDPSSLTSAAATLAALQTRVRKLLLAGPWDATSPLTRLARQINTYAGSVAKLLRAPPTQAGYPPIATAPTAPPPTFMMRFPAEGEALIKTVDALLADPDNEPLRHALEETVQQISSTLPGGLGPAFASRIITTDTQPPPAAHREPSHAPTTRPTLGQPLVELHRLDTAEHHWWRGQLGALRRRTDLALFLAIITLVGLGAILFGGGAPRPETNLAPPPDQAPAVADPTPQTHSPAPAGDGSLALLSAMTTDDVRALLQLPGRLSELDLEVLKLGARLEALEAQQVAADRARILAPIPSANPQTHATQGTKPVVPTPAGDTQPSTDRPGYGLQIATLKGTVQVQRFIEENSIDPRQLRIVQTGKRVLLIHGLYADRAQAGAAIANLPQALRRQGAIIHPFAPGKPPPTLAVGDPSPGR
jgi:septal ring-binding cell division protein DamX